MKAHFQFYKDKDGVDVAERIGELWYGSPGELSEICAEFVGAAANFAAQEITSDEVNQQLIQLADWIADEYGG